MGLKAGVQVQATRGTLKAKLKEQPCFYLIHISFCDTHMLKLGKSTVGIKRFYDYERAYDGHYEVIHLRTFDRAGEGQGFDVKFSTKTSWVDQFERDVIKELKNMGVQPKYQKTSENEFQSSEYYKYQDMEKILQAIQKVVSDLKGEAIERPLRRSPRINKQVYKTFESKKRARPLQADELVDMLPAPPEEEVITRPITRKMKRDIEDEKPTPVRNKRTKPSLEDEQIVTKKPKAKKEKKSGLVKTPTKKQRKYVGYERYTEEELNYKYRNPPTRSTTKRTKKK